MAITTNEAEQKRLRSYLTPTIRGKNTDAVLAALATSSSYLVNSVAAVNDSLYIATASGNYLDLRLADFGITRDPTIGLGDDVFRQIGIQVKNRKQVRDLINNILDIVFGDEFVKTISSAQKLEPYNLQDGDTLIVNFDGAKTSTITFYASQFTSIAAATAQEVANVISIGLKSLGVTGSAIKNNDGNGNYVQLLSNTIGASSSITVLGGRAQNVLLFNSTVPAGGNFSTQWTISIRPGGVLRYTWSGGADPKLGVVQPTQYVNVFGGGFASSNNEGSFTITGSEGGAVNTAYFEIYSPTGSPGIVVQGTDVAVQFFVPIRETLLSRQYYAAVYQTESNILNIFMPATTKIIKRSRIGSMHLHGDTDPGPSTPNSLGPYLFDTQQGFTIGQGSTSLTADVNGQVIMVGDSTQFPDSSGYLVLDYGGENQEVVPYIARPSSGTLLISPAYFIQKEHLAGTTVLLIDKKSPIIPKTDGTDYQGYLTDTASGRVYSQKLIESIAAAGVVVLFHILYPNDIGLGGWGTPHSEIVDVYGP